MNTCLPAPFYEAGYIFGYLLASSISAKGRHFGTAAGYADSGHVIMSISWHAEKFFFWVTYIYIYVYFYVYILYIYISFGDLSHDKGFQLPTYSQSHVAMCMSKNWVP